MLCERDSARERSHHAPHSHAREKPHFIAGGIFLAGGGGVISSLPPTCDTPHHTIGVGRPIVSVCPLAVESGGEETEREVGASALAVGSIQFPLTPASFSRGSRSGRERGGASGGGPTSPSTGRRELPAGGAASSASRLTGHSFGSFQSRASEKARKSCRASGLGPTTCPPRRELRSDRARAAPRRFGRLARAARGRLTPTL
jgi:hypothetical protein